MGSVESPAALGDTIRTLCHLQRRDSVAALEAGRRAVEVSERSAHALAVLASALFESGNRQEASKTQSEVEALASRQYVSPFHLAHAQTAAGKPKVALELLKRGAREGDWWVL